MEFIDGNFYTAKNDTGSCVFQFEDCEGNPFDLTGWKLEFIIKKCKFEEDDTALYMKEFSVDGSQLQIDFLKGELNFEPGTYYYGVRVHDEYNIRTLLDGKFIVGRTTFYAAPQD